jgi:hypothetical protein
MELLNQTIHPFNGLDDIKLLESFDEVKEYLKQNNIKYSVEHQSNKGCDPEVPWEIIHIDNSISLMFAKNKLWQIYLEENFTGSLPNGIKIGMKMDDALKIDSSLKFDDLNEDYESESGYWLEDNIDDNTVLSIAIFIKEVLHDETFFKYNW